MESTLPPTAVVRVSRGNFDPARLAEVERMARDTGTYLIPAIGRLPGLLHYSAAVSPSGSMVHVSIWDSDEHAAQMGRLKEMIVDAREAALAVGVEFIPIVNYPIAWNIVPKSMTARGA
jgi:hypothetical protein